MKFGQILLYLITNISDMFLTQCWIMENSSKPFYDFNKMKIQRDLSNFSSSYLPFLIHPYLPFQKRKRKHWKLDVIGIE